MMGKTFTPARDLKRQYEIFGHFYSIKVKKNEEQKCRSVLEIISKNVVAADEESLADAVIVMMNPGSSRPVVEKDPDVVIDSIAWMSETLVPALPDTTQYQVMRVMNHMKWRHVRVINLSDLCDPKSGTFYKRYLQIENDMGSAVHSIFSQERSAELKQHLSRKSNGVIICAWGVADVLSQLINRASTALSHEYPVIGWQKPSHPGRYFHPLPMLQTQKEEWLIQTFKLLQAKI
jgi:CBS domain-containing protein